MHNDMLKGASFPHWYKTSTENFVFPGSWLCSLKIWFILDHFSILFLWADITVSFLITYVQRANLKKSLAKTSCLYFDEALCTPCTRVNVASVLSLCQPQSWDWVYPILSPPPPISLFLPASGSCHTGLMWLKIPIVLCYPGNFVA